MDLTPFVPLISVIVGAAATLGGVAITTRSSRRADDRRLQIEADRANALLAREDEAEQRAREQARVARAAQLYQEISQGFINELSTLRSTLATGNDYSGSRFDTYFDSQWAVNGDMRLRRAVASVMDYSHRRMIIQILDAIIDHKTVGLMKFEDGPVIVEKLLLLGFDLVATYARGQALDNDLDARWKAFRTQVQLADDYTERQRQTRQEQLRAEMQKRAQERAAKESADAEAVWSEDSTS